MGKDPLGKSANNALSELLLERDLLAEERLQSATIEAERLRVPLEQILLRQRDLRPADCKALLMARRERGRNCRTCAKVTYLLSRQEEEDTPCEFCGGKLMPGLPRRLTRATLRRMAPLDGGGAPPPPRRTRPLRSPSMRHPAPRRTLRHGEGAKAHLDELSLQALRQTARDEVDAYLEKHQIIRRAVHEAREQSIRITEEQLQEGAQLSEEASQEAIKLALQAVKKRLQQQDVSALVEKMFERALRAFDAKLQEDGLLNLSTKIDARAADAARETLREQGLEALRADLQRQLEAFDADALASQVASHPELASRLEEVSRRAAREGVEDSLEDLDLISITGELERLRKDVALAAEARDETLDPTVFAEQVRQRVLPAVEARLAQVEGGNGGGPDLHAVEKRLRAALDAALAEQGDRIGAAEAAFARGGVPGQTPPAPPIAVPISRPGGEGVLGALHTLTRVVRRRLRPMVLTFMLLSLGAVLGLTFTPDTYRAKVVIGPTSYHPYSGPARRLAALALARDSVESVAQELGHPAGPGSIERLGLRVEPSGPPGRVEHLVVEAAGSSPREARQAASLVAERLLAEERALLERGSTKPAAGQALSVLRPAELSSIESAFASLPRWLGLALLLSLLVGVFLELRRYSFHEADEVAHALNLPVLTVVPHASADTRARTRT